MHDQFHNVVSTGPYTDPVSKVSISFDAQTTINGGLTDSVQNPSWLPGTTTYNLQQGNGQLCLTNYFSLFAAGNDWLKAQDDADPTINSQVVNFSTRPIITVLAGSPSQFVVSPPGDVHVAAGSLSLFGNYSISAKLADSYDNFASSAGIAVQISTLNVVGSTGTISTDVTGSNATPPTPIFSAVTDSSGTVGISTPIYYYISHTVNDSAQIRFSASVAISTTGKIITDGGTSSKLVIVAGPASQTAGTIASSLSPFTLERRDDFNNPTGQNTLNVVLDDTANGQVAIHSGRGFTPGNHDFEFEVPNVGTPIGGFSYAATQTRQNFVYYDKMTSTPLEDGRTSSWLLQAFVGATYVGSTIKTQFT